MGSFFRLLLPGVAVALISGCAPNSPAAPAGAPSPAAVPVVGYLQITSSGVLEETREGYLRALAEGGFEDGKTVRLQVRDAQGSMSDAQLIAREFASQPVTLIATASTPALQAAMKATEEIPIVFSTVADARLAGVTGQDGTRRRNVTGVITANPVDEAVRLAHQVVPSARKLGTVYDANEAFSEMFLGMARSACKELDLEYVEIPVSNPTEIVPGVQALQARGVEMIVQVPGAMIGSAIAGEIAEARRLGLPFFSSHRSDVEKGGIAAIGWDYRQAGYEAGKVAVRVLKGEKPSDIPIESVQKAELVINPAAAAAFQVTLPKAVRDRATRTVK